MTTGPLPRIRTESGRDPRLLTSALRATFLVAREQTTHRATAERFYAVPRQDRVGLLAARQYPPFRRRLVSPAPVPRESRSGQVISRPPLADRGHEPVEHRERIERPRRALGVVLDRLDRLLGVAKTLDGPVVEVQLADVEARA